LSTNKLVFNFLYKLYKREKNQEKNKTEVTPQKKGSKKLWEK